MKKAKKTKNSIKILSMIIGTLIGAGFASGKEVYLFFGKHGNLGIIGIIIASILTGIIVYKTLKTTARKEVDTYKELLKKIEIKSKKSNTERKIKKCLNILVNIFLLISFYIMVAGFSAYIEQKTPQIPIYVVSLIFVLICYVIFRKSIEGILKVNEILVPMLLGTIILLGIKNIPYIIEKIQNEPQAQTNFQISFIIDSILYASYNSILLIPTLTSLREYIAGEKQIRKISVLTAIVMLLLSICIYGLLIRGNFFVQGLEMPLVEITKEFGTIYEKLYGIIIIVSIFTTAISTGYSLLKNITTNQKEYNKKLLYMSISAILISNIGFSNLVQILYPIFGLLGILQIIFLLKNK